MAPRNPAITLMCMSLTAIQRISEEGTPADRPRKYLNRFAYKRNQQDQEKVTRGELPG